MKKIVITRFVTAEAYSPVLANSDAPAAANPHHLYELVPGDILPVCARKGDTLLLPHGYAELPSDAWRWATPGVRSECFIHAWQKAQSVCEVAVLFGKSVRKIHSWERRCRNEGVPLKGLPLV